MPKKKIAADTPEETVVMPEAEETSDLVGLLQDEYPVESESEGTGDTPPVLGGQEADTEVQDGAQGIPSQPFPDDEAPDEVSLISESEPAETSKASETAPEVENPPASDDPYGIDYPASAAGVTEGEPAEGVPAPDADLSDTGSKEAVDESTGPTEEDSEEASEAAKSAKGSEDRTPGEERRAFYDLDFNELDRDLSPEQRQEWNSIYASYRGRNAMSGTIVGVDLHRLRVRDRKTGEMTSRQLYCAIVIPFRVRILIPETEMWMRGEERPGFVLRNMPGSKIDFVIIHVDREAGFAVGSRKLAMPSRRYYFSTQPTMNAPGSRVNCDVLVVGPRRCLVSCHGYDIDLSQRELSYTAIPDLREVYHSGQALNCVVKDFDRENNRLSVSVKETAPNPYDGAEFRHPVQSHRQGVIAGKYGGGVFCNLPDGVTVMCSYSFHYDDSAFRSGDRVMLIIQRYDDRKKQIYGKIVAKC